MKNGIRRSMAFVLAILLAVCTLPFSAFAEGEQTEYTSTILFTHDMHDHFLPVTDSNGEEVGGFARLATLLKQERETDPDAVTVDAGDFSMGSLFQSVYATQAPELRIMGMLGYDATTFGNHEFDYRESGVTEMLETAVNSGEETPPIVEANYFPPEETADDYDELDAAAWQAFEDYGVQDYILLERGGITYGIFGLNGENSAEDAPESGMILYDAAEKAQQCVDEIKANADPDQPLFIICLSHSGTNADPKKSEDEILASEVDGIDVIISGHTHTVLEEPIQVNNTLIVSCGCYTAYLGVLNVTWDSDGSKIINRYELVPVSESVDEDPEIAAWIDDLKNNVAEDYLSNFGFSSFDEVIAHNSVEFDTVDDVYNEHRESGLGDLIADAYRSALQMTGDSSQDDVTLTLTATGVIRDSFAQGDITVSDAFNVSSLGIGADELAGYPLVKAYLTGKEIKAICEVDASVTPLMQEAQLHISGVKFTWNSHRMIFNRVVDAEIVHENGITEKLQDDKLYGVVTGLYCAQMLSAVRAKSYGLLSITPKYADGSEITDFDDCVIYDSNGSEIKEWYALASYLQSFPNGEIPDDYANVNSVDRKVQVDSWSPAALLKNANRLTVAVLCIVLAVILGLYLLVRKLVRRVLYGTYAKSETRSSRYNESGRGGWRMPRHNRPSVSARRYGRGYQPPKVRKHRKHVSKRKYGKFEYSRDPEDELPEETEPQFDDTEE